MPNSKEVPGTQCLGMHLISPKCEDSRFFSESSMLYDIKLQKLDSILIRIMVVFNVGTLDQLISSSLDKMSCNKAIDCLLELCKGHN